MSEPAATLACRPDRPGMSCARKCTSERERGMQSRQAWRVSHGVRAAWVWFVCLCMSRGSAVTQWPCTCVRGKLRHAGIAECGVYGSTGGLSALINRCRRLTLSSKVSLSLMLATPLGSTTLTAQGAAAAAWRHEEHAWRAAATDLESVKYPRTICTMHVKHVRWRSVLSNYKVKQQLLQHLRVMISAAGTDQHKATDT